MKNKRITILLAALGLAGCDNNEVGDVSLGLFTTKDIKIEVLTDPEVPGVTCHMSNIVADLDLADPSDMSISCRQTGEITPAMIAGIDRSTSGDIVFKKSKSIFLKSLKIRRIFDDTSQSLLYIAYSTKETSGSYKHSMSTVPLWGTAAYQLPNAK
ncbi:putative lipoprotein [Oceanimonas sp. GK1]|uniref:CreA family protein n=1 Tax=Oceanimonas sp. (strain GK1 / IBRC-M 10197) TaxID=511062 RepID=UPI0002494E67|nr:CreA family protein [Oceanimonas sp. GK1]AEY02136.1 putative lipoprotein [Oceanimonas sp. GK1]